MTQVASWLSRNPAIDSSEEVRFSKLLCSNHKAGEAVELGIVRERRKVDELSSGSLVEGNKG